MIPMEIIATIRSDFPTKFGIPRQSGLVEELRVYITQQNNWVFRNGTHNFYLLSITSY